MTTNPAGVGPVDHEVRPFAWASKSGRSFVSDEAWRNVPIYRDVYTQPLVTLAQAEAMVAAERLRAELAARPMCPGRPDSHCNYDAICGQVCNKCGRVHNGYANPNGTITSRGHVA
jgi:hypothetical protein